MTRECVNSKFSSVVRIMNIFIFFKILNKLNSAQSLSYSNSWRKIEKSFDTFARLLSLLSITSLCLKLLKNSLDKALIIQVLLY